MLKSQLVIIVALLTVGCADGAVGRAGDVVGGPCTADGECADGSRCLVEGDFPGGTCTVECASQSDCPDGSACVQENGGTCLLACDVTEDCRDGYACESKSRLGDPGEARVCID